MHPDNTFNGGVRGPPPVDFCYEDTKDENAFYVSYIMSLLDMAQDSIYEIIREGIDGLASCLGQIKYVNILLSTNNIERVLAIISEFLQSRDDKIQRVATICLYNLCNNGNNAIYQAINQRVTNGQLSMSDISPSDIFSTLYRHQAQKYFNDAHEIVLTALAD